MNIKSLLLGSAAALAAVTGAQAADAIVAAEPEPMEYVRVCDAFGTGFFYIPGTETCLKIGGYVRFQTDVNRGSLAGNGRTSDWDSFTRAQLQFTAKSDTELGALTSVIALRGQADNGSTTAARPEFVDAAYIELAGFRVGFQYNYWDDGLSGESDALSSNATNMNSVRYTYDAGSFAASISVDELEGVNRLALGETDNNFGVSGQLSGKLGGFTYALLGGYDADMEEGAVRGIVTAAIGPGTLGLAGVYATGRNYYYEASEWAVAAEYALKATDKLTLTPGAQYFGNYGAAGDDFGDNDAWQAGLTVDYKITENLTTKVSAQYQKIEDGDDQVFGFVRLQRSF
jgi:opacity protein-like surface antigen